jgi:hypothetical protein
MSNGNLPRPSQPLGLGNGAVNLRGDLTRASRFIERGDSSPGIDLAAARDAACDRARPIWEFVRRAKAGRKVVPPR